MKEEREKLTTAEIIIFILLIAFYLWDTAPSQDEYNETGDVYCYQDTMGTYCE
jgi:hypothetical protein